MRLLRKTLILLGALLNVGFSSHLNAQSMTSQINQFCKQSVNPTSNTITLSVQKILSLDLKHGTNTQALDSVSVFEIDLMTLNCRLFVGQKIDEPTFISTQTQILQFAMDVEGLRSLAESKAASNASQANSKNPSDASASKSTADSKQPASGTTTATPSSNSGTGTQPATAPAPAGGSSGSNGGKAKAPKTKSAKGDQSVETGKAQIQAVAKDLGIVLNELTGEHSLGPNPLQDGINSVVTHYSPIKIKD